MLGLAVASALTFYLIEFALFFHYGIKSVNVASMCCGNNKAPKQLVFICSTFRLRVSQDLIKLIMFFPNELFCNHTPHDCLK